jgi:hypothetical protein
MGRWTGHISVLFYVAFIPNSALVVCSAQSCEDETPVSNRPRHVCKTPPRPRVPHSLRRPRASRPREWHDCRLLTLNSSVTLLNNQLDPCPSHSFRRPTIPPHRFFTLDLEHYTLGKLQRLRAIHSQAPHHVIPRRSRMLDCRQPAEPVHQARPG